MLDNLCLSWMASLNEQMVILESLETQAAYEFTRCLPSAGRRGAPEEEGPAGAQHCWIDGFEVRVSRHSGDHGTCRAGVASSSVLPPFLLLFSFSPLLPPSHSRFLTCSSSLRFPQYPARMVSNLITRQECSMTPCCSPGAPSRIEHERARDESREEGKSERGEDETATRRTTGYEDGRRVAAGARLARRRGTRAYCAS